MKGNYYKKITRFYGYARGDLWDYNRCRRGKSKVRRLIKNSEHKRYRQFNKRIIEELNGFSSFSQKLQRL